METNVAIEYGNCSTVTAVKNAAGSADVFADTYKNSLGVPGATVSATLTAAGSCARRLQNEPSGRRLSTPQLNAAYVVTVPAGTDPTNVQNSMQSINANTFQTALNNNLAANPSTSSLAASTGIGTFSAPATGIAGYTCYTGQGCYFHEYAVNTHYKIHQKSPVLSTTACATACNLDAKCEAFESLSQVTGSQATCSFWYAGACKLPGTPPGHVTNFNYLTGCDKGSRSAFTPVASMCRNSHVRGPWLLMLSIFLVVVVTG